MRNLPISTLLLLLAGGTPIATRPLAAQPPLVHADVVAQAQPSGLEPALRQAAAQGAQPLWVGYSVPMIAGLGKVCCHDELGSRPENGVCELEDRNHGWTSGREHPRAEQALNVLIRFSGGKAGEVRAFSSDCRLDAGGRRFVWLGNAQPEASVTYLAGLARQAPGGERRGFGEEALAVLALHRDPKADAALESLAAPSSPFQLRQSALFWMGQHRGERGARFLAAVIKDDRDDRLRDHAIFSLSQSKVPWAQETILRTAQSDRSPQIRGQALFWLAQIDAPGAKGAILQAIAKDADSKVRGQAVFALSQLRGKQAVPALLELVRESRDPAVRKEALFWLAQSQDPAALAYLDRVLND